MNHLSDFERRWRPIAVNPVPPLARELYERFLLPCGRHYAERPKWRSPYDLRLGVQCEWCPKGGAMEKDPT